MIRPLSFDPDWLDRLAYRAGVRQLTLDRLQAEHAFLVGEIRDGQPVNTMHYSEVCRELALRHQGATPPELAAEWADAPPDSGEVVVPVTPVFNHASSPW